MLTHPDQRMYNNLMVLHDFYSFLKKLSQSDERVSRHFLNMLDHLMLKIKRGDPKKKTLKHHCFFANESQALDLLVALSEMRRLQDLKEMIKYVFPASLDWHTATDKYDPLPELEKDGKVKNEEFNWRTRVKSNRAFSDHLYNRVVASRDAVMNKKKSSNKKQSSGGVSSSQTNEYVGEDLNTFYKGDSLQYLLQFFRNLGEHWVKLLVTDSDLTT